MSNSIQFEISFKGSDSDRHQIDFYDVSEALIGFQRSLAITTHLILNGQVITQAPSLKSARIVALPPEEGSWKLIVLILGSLGGAAGSGIAYLNAQPKNTPLGHLFYSVYDYVVMQTLGFHVDYDKTLGIQYEELKRQNQDILPILDQNRFDSVIEKSMYAIEQIHRPIVKSGTANIVEISQNENGLIIPLSHNLTRDSYDYIKSSKTEESITEFSGRVSSYNINTYKGRIFIKDFNRSIPFELVDSAKYYKYVSLVVDSLKENANDMSNKNGNLNIEGYKVTSRSGSLKSLLISTIRKPEGIS